MKKKKQKNKKGKGRNRKSREDKRIFAMCFSKKVKSVKFVFYLKNWDFSLLVKSFLNICTLNENILIPRIIVC